MLMRSFSWELISDDTLIKYVDYSTFEHNTSTIDKNFYSFFGVSNESEEKVNLTLIDENKIEYSAHIRHAKESRTSPVKLIVWKKDFENYLKNNIAGWEKIKKGDKSSRFKIIFQKTETKNLIKVEIQNVVINDFKDLLEENGISPNEVQLIRHFSGLQNDMTETYYSLWKDNIKEFDIQTGWQLKDKFKDRKYLAAFVSTPSKETLFVRFYKILNQESVVREDGKGYFYNLEHLNLLKNYEGRLKIEWGQGGEQAWAQIAGNTAKKIVSDDVVNGLDDLIPGKSYVRSELHSVFGGNQRRGIVLLPKFNTIFLLPSKKNEGAGYEAMWDDGVYHLSGEGLIGDQTLTMGNKALVKSIEAQDDIYLFVPIAKKSPFTHTFHSKVKCINYEHYKDTDQEGNIRRMYRFYFKSSEHPDFQKTGYQKIREEIQEDIEEDFIKSVLDETTISTKERVLSTNEYEVARKKAVKRQQSENQLVAEYKKYLENDGFKTKHTQVDLIATKNGKTTFIEAKILKNATTAAHGLGQILHYDYILKNKADELALLFDIKPNNQTIEFIKKFNIRIIFKDGSKFISI
jgi:hypothetical protein